MSTIAQENATAAFVGALRTPPRTLDLSRKGEPTVTIRVEMAQLWNAVRVVVSPNEPVVTVKRAALEAVDAGEEPTEEFVMKLHGWEVLDEGASLVDAGATDGSIFLLMHRRRRPVR